MASLWFGVFYSTASPQSLCIKVYNDLAPYCSSKGRGVNGTAGRPGGAFPIAPSPIWRLARAIPF
jgi:hypothetical protein